MVEESIAISRGFTREERRQLTGELGRPGAKRVEPGGALAVGQLERPFEERRQLAPAVAIDDTHAMSSWSCLAYGAFQPLNSTPRQHR